MSAPYEFSILHRHLLLHVTENGMERNGGAAPGSRRRLGPEARALRRLLDADGRLREQHVLQLEVAVADLPGGGGGG
jgi:hypothetical protein